MSWRQSGWRRIDIPSATVRPGGAVAGGEVIAGRYRLDAEIGSGGMGEVWRATDRETGATVALKRVRLSHLTGGERDRARRSPGSSRAGCSGRRQVTCCASSGPRSPS
ncbi:hypothetical protein FHX44_117959 [Pseudonocardia hierapolitana]|uniref:Protein kinase domain-containing protein n=1 Tax=Pseudonocardia hierapolitana TaxID=1128676 RepID=A0A561T4I3_9PSEU|nr:hypothetical protein FHX44_117959 [Pseudonocardia hierapolitana]